MINATKTELALAFQKWSNDLGVEDSIEFAETRAVELIKYVNEVQGGGE